VKWVFGDLGDLGFGLVLFFCLVLSGRFFFLRDLPVFVKAIIRRILEVEEAEIS